MSKDSIAITGQSAAAARAMAADRAQAAKPAGEMFGNKVAQAGHNNAPPAGKFKARVEHFFTTTLPKALTTARDAVLSLLRPAAGAQPQTPGATAKVRFAEQTSVDEPKVARGNHDARPQEQAKATAYTAMVAQVETGEIEEARVGIYGVSDDARPEGPGKAYATVVARVETGVIEEARVGIYGVSEAGEAEGEISGTREGVYKAPFA